MPDQAASSSITADSSFAASARAAYAAASAILASSSTADAAKLHAVGQVSILGLGSLTANTHDSDSAICTMVASSSCSATAKAQHQSIAHVIAGSTLACVATVKSPFRPIPIPNPNLPVVRSVPQGTPRPSYTIQAPKPVVPLGAQAVKVKR